MVALALAFTGAVVRAQTTPTNPSPAAQAAPAAAAVAQASQSPTGQAPADLAAPAATPGPASGAQAAPAPTGTLHGHILDQTGALIPGAQVTVATAAGKNVAKVTADAAGGYQVRGLAAGSYVIEAGFSGFAPFVSAPIALSAGQTKNIDIKMAIEAAQQQVVVTDEGGPTVSTEAGSNANSMVLKGSDLDALSDDPDELSSELTALAGPSAGPNGGQIYIDGFTGGQLPPKSAIREIRINQNPFSAEFDKIGYGRIEILTKPGTDTLHGRVFSQGNDNVFNTGNPFTKELPSYYSFQYNATLSGALSKWASFFISVEQRDTQVDNVYSIPGGPVFDAASNTWSISSGTVAGSLFSPGNHLEISPRIDLQLGQKNTLTMRYQFERNNVSGSLGQTSLPSTSNTSDSLEHAIQLDDTQVISDRIVNETRFEYRRANSSSAPVSTAPAFGVPSVFSGGGNGSQSSNTHSDHYELQNFVTMSEGKQAIKIGAWLRDDRNATSTDGNFNGSFTFPSVTAFVDTWNGVEAGDSIAAIAAACPTTQAGECGPTKLTYTTGPEAFQGNVFNAALFYQDDWTVNKLLTLSGGLRWESQNHIADHSDWAPRVAFAYALDGHKKGAVTKTVLRGGFGFFYDRLGVGNLMNLEMLNGTSRSQTQITIADPACFNGASLGSISGGVASCGTGTAATPVIYSLSPTYRSPYMEQLGMSVERQVTKAATLTLTYMHSSGFHQLVTRDSNAYLPGTFQYGSTTLTGTRPDPSLGIVKQYFPEAVFNENQLIVNVNARFSPKLSLVGFYAGSWANSDGGAGSNPSNSYDLRQDYGRAAFIRPQWLFLMGNYTGPWDITFNPFLVFQAGQPYNVTSPYDLTGDAFFNDRPAYASASSPPDDPNVVQTSFGALDVNPQSGGSIIPISLGNSPSSVAVNLRVGRTFGIGPKVESPGGPSPGGGGGGRGGGFGGPFGGGGGRGGMFGGGANTNAKKYSLNFNVQALNLFNDINLGKPVGGIQPTFDATTGLYGPGAQFGKSSGLAGGIFSTSSAARRVFVQAAFQF
jgi:hypothetical protein